MRSTNLSIRLLFVAIVALSAAVLLSSCRRLRPSSWRNKPQRLNVNARHGRELYLRYCALCHGRNAQGYAADHANALGNSQFLSIATDQFLRASIAQGRPGTPMSAWSRELGGPLDGSEINDIVMWLRSRARRPVRNVDSEWGNGDAGRGRIAYMQHCVSCHGEHGQGSERATSISHAQFLQTVGDGYLRTTIAEGRPGTIMQSFRATLSQQSIDDIVRFIRTQESIPGPPVPIEYEPPPDVHHIVMNPSNPAPAFTLREDRYVSGEQVLQAIQTQKRMVILDTRATSDWSRGHVVGAVPFPFYNIEDMAHQLPNDDTWIVAYCACPHAASGHVVDLLRQRGFKHTAVLDEGVTWWLNHGYPSARAAVLRH
jgi:cytochrome c oxidase cbb3-type subunit III